jgi:hypothetical protein
MAIDDFFTAFAVAVAGRFRSPLFNLLGHGETRTRFHPTKPVETNDSASTRLNSR